MCQHNLPCSIVYAHCLLPGKDFASLYVLLFLEKEAVIGGRDCPAYDSLRQHLFRKASNLCEGFSRNDDIEKIIVLFSTKSLVRIVAKTFFLILRKRSNLLYI